GGMSVSDILTVDASSLPNPILINGNSNGPIFNVAAGASLLLDSLTLTNGYARGGSGGAIGNGGTVALNRCTLAGNSSDNHGGPLNTAGPLPRPPPPPQNIAPPDAAPFQTPLTCPRPTCPSPETYPASTGAPITGFFPPDPTLTQSPFPPNTA